MFFIYYCFIKAQTLSDSRCTKHHAFCLCLLTSAMVHFPVIQEDEEELQRMRGAGLMEAMTTRVSRPMRGVSWSFVFISVPLLVWIYSLDSDITNIFWE